MQKEALRERVMQDGGVIPATGFPRDSGMETSDNSDTVQTYGTSHTTHAFDHGRSSRVIPLKRAFPGGTSSERCRGSRRSRDVGEVVVLAAAVVEVVVHVS